ncbi:hypothetical protein P775_04685 [Puniceibacterium antarcticum]|uniref:Chorismate mutase n=1 Tax=Puniceibacterium antarcticum TaxID=1206336 RepID=A0A2G8RI90_9RHOB|nr:hypothetical protein [Puniceibacterium antarcticum]PIL21287.1 hypothetical protein P775_04685 [Puniceibacterium antarcticum]
MKHLCKWAASLVFLGLAAPVQAADFSDPTWPCIQRKVENLSVGLMWPREIAQIKMTPELATEVDELAARLVLRRVDLDEAQRYINAFAAKHGQDDALMGHVFEKVFDRLAARRTLIMRGIEDFSLKQIAMSERIDTARTEMDTLMATAEPDYDKVDKLEEQVDWDERIYTDRQKSLTYVCETPVLLEKRLYAIAQMLIDVSQS